VTLQATISPSAGGSPDVTQAAPLTFLLYKSTNTTMASPDKTCTATSVSATSGVATCTVASLVLDNWMVVVQRGTQQSPDNGYFNAPNSDPVVITVYQPATDKFATGGGWIHDPGFQSKPVAISSQNDHGNFGFTVRYKNGSSPSGQAVYAFRGADGYDYVFKSNSWQNGGLALGTKTAGFNGKGNVTVINPKTGLAVSGLGGGNYAYRVDVIDNGTPGTNDSYALSVYSPTGALYHQAGTTSGQLLLGGGNVVVHTQ